MQTEIKMVLFSPTDWHYAVDIYVDGERIYLGQGWPNPGQAITEAANWLLREKGGS